METDLIRPSTSTSRLGSCEVCGDQEAKYTCPECEVKTCSLTCSKIHKKELECSGIRNRVKYRSLRTFTDLDFQNDYMMLEQAGRDIENLSKRMRKLRPSLKERERSGKILEAAYFRKIKLQFLPFKFKRHQVNTTYLNWKEKKLYWHIEWVFPEAEGFTCTDSRIIETELMSKSVSKYIDADKAEEIYKDKLSVYQNAGPENCLVLLKAEKLPNNKFFLMKNEESLTDNFKHKVLIEYPVLYVIFAENINNYSIVHLVQKKKLTENKNLLISTGENEIEEILED